MSYDTFMLQLLGLTEHTVRFCFKQFHYIVSYYYMLLLV